MPHPHTTEAQLTTPELKRIRQRLERWELTHLRKHCLQLDQEIERLRADLASALERERVALADASFWHDQALSLVDTATEAGHTVGMTADGHMGVMRDFTPVTDAASAVALLNPSAGRLQ